MTDAPVPTDQLAAGGQLVIRKVVGWQLWVWGKMDGDRLWIITVTEQPPVPAPPTPPRLRSVPFVEAEALLVSAHVQSSVVLPNGRRWITLGDHLMSPVSFVKKGCAAKTRKGLVEFLAMAHHWGGAMGVTGSMRHVGIRAVSLGLASVIAAERANGRKVVHYRLTDGTMVADLAERCFYAAREKGSVHVLSDGEAMRVPSLATTVAWSDVPTVVPLADWLPGARACPKCHCNPDSPCSFLRDDGEVEGHCVAAGVHDLPACSACEDDRPAVHSQRKRASGPRPAILVMRSTSAA